MEKLKGLMEVLTRHIPDETVLDETTRWRLASLFLPAAAALMFEEVTPEEREEREKIVYEILKAKYEKDS